MSDTNQVYFGSADVSSQSYRADVNITDTLAKLQTKIELLFSSTSGEVSKFITFLTYLALKTLPSEFDSEIKSIMSEKSYKRLFQLLVHYDPNNIVVISEYFLS